MTTAVQTKPGQIETRELKPGFGAELLDGLREAHLALVDVGDVRGPAVEAVEDVRAVDDARAALLALLRQELE